MAYYYKINESKDILPPYKGFHLQKVKELKTSGPNITYDFSKHVLIELLDDITPESKLWSEMGLTYNKNIVHKRMMIDSHRIKCRRAILICITANEAQQLAQRLSQTKVMNRCVCAVVISDLLSDLCLFEKQIIQFGDNRSQHQLLYVSDLSRSRGPSGLTQFLKENFSPFGTILSIFVCSDDDGYAYPEGVVKFAYLSEAFAAELAFDQFIVGKERLSVTTHHNIVLSQCDLRVRLKDAQWRCNVENHESSESYLHLHNSESDNLETGNDSAENRVNNLHISHVSSSENKDNSVYDALENTLPAFSQFNLHKQLRKNDFDKTVSYVNKKNCEGQNSLSSTHKNSCHNKNANKIMNSSKIINFHNRQTDICTPETATFEMSTTKIINLVDKEQKSKSHSRKNVALDSLLNIDKSSKNQSDFSSFVRCDSLDTYSKDLFLSPKKSSYKNFNSQQTNSVLESPPISYHIQISGPSEGNLDDSESVKEPQPKHSKKRKKFTPSQKLSLKSQRTGSSQDLKTNTQVSEQSSSGQRNFKKDKKTVSRKNLSVIEDNENIDSSKVAEWLLHLPVSNNEELSSMKGVEDHKVVESSETSKVANCLLCLRMNPQAQKHSLKKKIDMHSECTFAEENKHCRTRISVHRTPALKSNVIKKLDFECSHDDLSENEDPNRMLLISSNQSDSIPLTDEYKSPLQMWLKQELVSSVNNTAYESKENPKSIIVCATRTGTNFISVGCSYMTCDTCYPESIDLLLGY